MARAMRGILLMQHVLQQHSNIHITLYTNTYFNISSRFPQIKDPFDTASPIKRKLMRTLRHVHSADAQFRSSQKKVLQELISSLSPEELQELHNENKRKFVPAKAARELIRESLEEMQSLLKAINPPSSLFDLMCKNIPHTIQEVKCKQMARCFYMWEKLKIHHEGVPPYQSNIGHIVEKLKTIAPGFERPTFTAKPISDRERRYLFGIIRSAKAAYPELFTSIVCALLTEEISAVR